MATKSSIDVAAGIRNEAQSNISQMQSKNDCSVSVLSYTQGSSTANKMLEVANDNDTTIASFLKSYNNDTNSFFKIAQGYNTLDDVISIEAGKLNG